MKLSVVIPAHNEEGSIASTVTHLHEHLNDRKVPCEIIVVNDHSSDSTVSIVQRLQGQFPSVKLIHNEGRNGFGNTVRVGLEHFSGDCVAIYMADASDSPEDLFRFYEYMKEGKLDCVFGSRFIKGSRIIDYPKHKLILNRLANWFIKVLFNIRYNDVTNAFKLYRRETIHGLKPFLSEHFNLTVELPLKAIVRNYKVGVLPNSWTNRKAGISKLKIKEMGSRYLFIVLYCWLEKWLSRGDYLKEKNVGK